MDEDTRKKLEDFELNPSYERRVVAFYDFLGWRSKIAQAGDEPKRIGDLRRMILRHTRSLAGQQQYASPEVRFSSFSDNVVVSHPINKPAVNFLLGTLGAFQLVSAAAGFLVRGGVTVGLIHHDEVSVFGPALNRAYEIESRIAKVPRIVLDESVTGLFMGDLPFFVDHDGDASFIDPFTLRFLGLLGELNKSATRDVYSTLGFPSGGPTRSLDQLPNDAFLKRVLVGLKPQLRVPLKDEEWAKLAWLYDRVAVRLGVPPASSYPRVELAEQSP